MGDVILSCLICDWGEGRTCTQIFKKEFFSPKVTALALPLPLWAAEISSLAPEGSGRFLLAPAL